MIELPVPAGIEPSRFTVEIGGVTAVFVTRWNSAREAWYLDVFANDGTPIRVGLRLTVGRPLGWRTLDPRFPGRTSAPFGWLVLIDTTGAGEDPGITDLGTRHRILFVEPTDIERLPATQRPIVKPAVPTDGPGNVFVPQFSAHWEAIGIPAPARQYSTQVASGDLTAIIGSGDMVASGTGHLYGQQLPGWERFAFAGKDTGASTWESVLNFALSAGERWAGLMYAQVDGDGLLWRSTPANVVLDNGGKPRLIENVGITVTDGAQVHTGVVRPYLLVAGRDANPQTFTLYTDLEVVAESAAGPGGADDALFGTSDSGFSVPTLRYGPVLAQWLGSGVDALEAAGLLDERLLEALGWEVAY